MSIAQTATGTQQLLYGLSTDTKPISQMLYGALFVETDTQKCWVLGSDNVWHAVARAEILTDATGTPLNTASGGLQTNVFIWQASSLSYVHALADASGNLMTTGGGGGGGTVTQGPTGTNAAAWWVQIGDTSHGPAAVKAASTAAVAADQALVVAVSPNNTVAATQ